VGSSSAQKSVALSWLFSPREDFLAFFAPPLVAIALTSYLSARGLLLPEGSLGPLGWLLSIVLIDVAHVYATLYRVYAHPQELRRRFSLYVSVPILAYGASVLLYFHSSLGFWRALAYLAVFHFVRQQYGWIALCARKEPHFSTWDRRLDALAVYTGTLYPLLYWHAHLPRRYAWFIDGDFLAPGHLLSPLFLRLCAGAWAVIGALWLLRQLQRVVFLPRHPVHLTRLAVMAGTWLTWYLGIVHYNSDVAFTLTNVLPHGIPYFVLLFRYRHRETATFRGTGTWVWALLLFYLPLGLLAFGEEGLWDRLVWHEHGMIFPGPDVLVGELWLVFLVPLLALPQATHYLLDAWIWRLGQENPELKRHLRL
jgi:hypothetical protein